jgi:hypothetical protein
MLVAVSLFLAGRERQENILDLPLPFRPMKP